VIDFIAPVFVPAFHVDKFENVEEMDIQNVRKCQGMGGACEIQSTSDRLNVKGKPLKMNESTHRKTVRELSVAGK